MEQTTSGLCGRSSENWSGVIESSRVQWLKHDVHGHITPVTFTRCVSYCYITHGSSIYFPTVSVHQESRYSLAGLSSPWSLTRSQMEVSCEDLITSRLYWKMIVSAMIWILLSPQNPCVEILTSKEMASQSGAFGEAIRSWGQNSLELGEYTYETGPGADCLPLHQERTQLGGAIYEEWATPDPKATSGVEKNKYMLFISHSIDGIFVLADQGDKAASKLTPVLIGRPQVPLGCSAETSAFGH